MLINLTSNIKDNNEPRGRILFNRQLSILMVDFFSANIFFSKNGLFNKLGATLK